MIIIKLCNILVFLAVVVLFWKQSHCIEFEWREVKVDCGYFLVSLTNHCLLRSKRRNFDAIRQYNVAGYKTLLLLVAVTQKFICLTFWLCMCLWCLFSECILVSVLIDWAVTPDGQICFLDFPKSLLSKPSTV